MHDPVKRAASFVGGLGAQGLYWASNYYKWPIPDIVPQLILVCSVIAILYPVFYWLWQLRDLWKKSSGKVRQGMLLLAISGILFISCIVIGILGFNEIRNASAQVTAAKKAEPEKPRKPLTPLGKQSLDYFIQELTAVLNTTGERFGKSANTFENSWRSYAAEAAKGEKPDTSGIRQQLIDFRNLTDGLNGEILSKQRSRIEVREYTDDILNPKLSGQQFTMQGLPNLYSATTDLLNTLNEINTTDDKAAAIKMIKLANDSEFKMVSQYIDLVGQWMAGVRAELEKAKPLVQ